MAADKPTNQHRGHPRFYELLKEMEDIHDRKNANYSEDGNPLSNFLQCESFNVDAFKGCLVRMSDKWSRITQLAKGKPDLVGEAITDTLQDLSVYALIAIILFEREQKKNLTPSK